MPERHSNLRAHQRGAAGDWPGQQPGPGVPAGDGPETNGPDADVERLRAELDAAQAQAAEHLASLQRTAADFANFRRRTTEDRERELGLASESLLRKLLAVADDFDRTAAQTAGSAVASPAWLTLRARAVRLGLMPAVADAPLAAAEIVEKASQL